MIPLLGDERLEAGIGGDAVPDDDVTSPLRAIESDGLRSSRDVRAVGALAPRASFA
jgi:hypothetical protein